MNSLMSYGSDDDSNESGDPRFPEMPGRQNVPGLSKNYRKPAAHEDNYEEVGMDMSEDSDDSRDPPSRTREEPRPNSRPDRQNSTPFGKRNDFPPTSGQHGSSYSQGERRSGSKSPKYRKEEDERRNNRLEDRSRDERHRGDREEDKYRRRGERSSRDSREEDRSKDKSVREEDKGRDKYREDRRDKRYSRDGRRDNRKRSRSRERRRSRSPRRASRSPKRASRSPRRSRSGSRDRGSKPFLSRREKADKRMDRLDKLGIQFKPDNYPASAIQEAETKSNSNGNRFFMPGITGRFREQIEKRKQLWQKSKEQDTTAGPSASPATVAPAGGSKATKVYEATTFSDDKTSNKFKRLMGIKETDTEGLPVKGTDVLKKQQEMFSSMEAQYEVARTATHTMRGVGLGFGSFQR